MASSHNYYESAVQDIEQEKKIVAALKRLSIGNLMNYDPDLPNLDTIDDINIDSINNNNNNSSSPSPIHSSSSTSPSPPPPPPPPSHSTSKSDSNSPYNQRLQKSPTSSPSPSHSQSRSPISSQQPVDIRRNKSLSRQASIKRQASINDTASIESNDEYYDASPDSSSSEINQLLWVPANLHPQINPESFKTHIKSQVDEIMESRRQSISRKSSLSSSSLPADDDSHDEDEENIDSKLKDDIFPKRESWYNNINNNKRFSNPSLRDLTNELSKLSKIAGMDATDAVTLARTLSSASLGYTDVEILAIDELNSPKTSPPPSTSPYQDFINDDEIDDGEISPSKREKNKTSPSKNNNDTFDLKRSRRPDYNYRKNSGSSTSGPVVPSAEKLQALRNNIRQMYQTSSTLPQTPSPPPSQPHYRTRNSPSPPPVPEKSIPKRNYRDSQLLFSYVDPNTLASSQPYPQAQPVQQQQPQHRHRHHNQVSPPQQELLPQLQSKRGSPYPINPNSRSIENQITQKLTQQHSMTAKRLSQLKLRHASNNNGMPPTPIEKDIRGGSAQNRSQDPYLNQQFQQRYRSATYYKTSQGQVPKPRVNSSNASNDSLNQNHPQQQTYRQYPAKNISPQQQQPQTPPPPQSSSQQQQRRSSQHTGGYPPQNGPIPQSHHPHGRHHQRSYQKQTDAYHYYQQQQQQLQKQNQQVPPQQQVPQQQQPYVQQRPPHSVPPIQNGPPDKSNQLNQNLDLLRSEINEFKESLNKSESTVSTTSSSTKTLIEKEVEKDTTPAIEFSFDTSIQDISYEDSLGFEKQVLGEFDRISPNFNDINTDDPIELKDDDDEDINENEFISKSSPIETPVEVSPVKETKSSPIKLKSPSPKKKSERKTSPSKIPVDKDVSTTTTPHVISLSKNGHENPFVEHDESPYPSPTINDSEVYKKDSSKELKSDNEKNQHHSHLLFSKSQPDHSDESSVETSPNKKMKKKKSFALLGNSVSEDSKNTTNKIKKKKSWGWLRDRSNSVSSFENNSNLPPLPETSINKVPPRSISNPEITNKNLDDDAFEVSDDEIDLDADEDIDLDSTNTKRSVSENAIHGKNKQEYSSNKENMITKLFKRKKPIVVQETKVQTLDDSSSTSGVTVDYDSDNDGKLKHQQIKGSSLLFKKKNKKTVKQDKDIKYEDMIIDTDTYFKKDQNKKIDESKVDEVVSRRKSPVSVNEEVSNDQNKEILSLGPQSESKKEEKLKEETGNDEIIESKVDLEHDEQQQEEGDEIDKDKPAQTTLEVQEKLKKSIKRTSKANQPIVFTDSAFGFPLPPPSQSTLVMLDYRFPVHVERAIYRLSHLKLANPKRSLREQVLLSNFMYAYLNLVDHTLHLEQQLNNSGIEGQEVTVGTLTGEEDVEMSNDLEPQERSVHRKGNGRIIFDDGIIHEDEVEDDQAIEIDLDVAKIENIQSTGIEA
ncbi:hypothetical protein DFJ63DRAFT_169425 [Scheffersomyces coipomensis]|uniref:uncharacterized protein n=1 Tax=Scheffersomyces coipomensis TaxID=1788519 RepID=UPI00315DC70A